MAPKPRTVDHVHAAAVPRAGLTAWQAPFEHGRLAKGQTVVIHGAGGAVGSTAVQRARWAGAQVIGTGRSHSRSLVIELGADRFIALDANRLEDAAGQADLVVDTIGGEVLALLRAGGTLAVHPPACLPIGTLGSADPLDGLVGTHRHSLGQRDHTLPLRRGRVRQRRKPAAVWPLIRRFYARWRRTFPHAELRDAITLKILRGNDLP